MSDMFTIPRTTLERTVNYLVHRPFIEVAPILTLIENTAQVVENKEQEDVNREGLERERDDSSGEPLREEQSN